MDERKQAKSKHKRRRLLGSGLCTSQKFHALGQQEDGAFCQLLYCLVQVITDDWGVVEADPFSLKARCLPANQRDTGAFGEAITAMHQVGLGDLYINGGKAYFQVWDFDDAQRGWIRPERRRPGSLPGADHKGSELLGLGNSAGKDQEKPDKAGLTLSPKPYSLDPKPYTLSPSPSLNPLSKARQKELMAMAKTAAQGKTISKKKLSKAETAFFYHHFVQESEKREEKQ